MKKIIIIICAVLVTISGIAFTASQNKSSIHGMIDPVNGAKKVWAISGSDTVSTIPGSESFWIDVKPGTWLLIVEAAKPYKNSMLDGITVQDGQSTDVGTIKLIKE